MASSTKVVSASQLAAQAAALIREVRETGEPVLVTEDSELAAVLVTAEEFASITEHPRFVAAVSEGLADMEAGRVLTTDELKRSLEVELGPIAWR